MMAKQDLAVSCPQDTPKDILSSCPQDTPSDIFSRFLFDPYLIALFSSKIIALSLALIEVSIKHGQILQVFQPQIFQLTHYKEESVGNSSSK